MLGKLAPGVMWHGGNHVIGLCLYRALCWCVTKGMLLGSRRR